ncbi:hypothetical protein TWF718_010404 [Orbilia javanica]|uniref:F-box domain-containing protein n=1 Tax=Orbilia javanica TaxID=47235 RepID=A0AAN8RE12_9PEZI
MTSHPLLSLPAELHLEILSHLPSLSDQISASQAYPPWKTLISKTESLKRHRYHYRRPWKQEGLHNLLAPAHYHTFLGLTTKSGVITSYSLYTFDRLHDDWHEKLAQVVHYRKRFPHRYGPGKRMFEDDDEDLGVNRRDYTDFSKLLKTLDISELGFLDEPLFSPYLPKDVIEEDWAHPLDFSYKNADRYEWAVLGKMFFEGFPITLRSTECPLLKHPTPRDFYTFYQRPTEFPSAEITLRQVAEKVVSALQKKIPEPIPEPVQLYGYRSITPKVPDRSAGVMRSEGMDPEKEHIVLLDENWYKTAWTVGEVGIAAFVIPCDDDEREIVVKRIKSREAEAQRLVEYTF